MRLPGGLWRDGQLRTEFAFKAITGDVELAIAECNGGSLPARVTTVLAASLEHLGGQRPTRQQIGQLCVGDRQFLTRQLAVCLGVDRLWLNPVCSHCNSVFDISVVQSQLPVKPAADGFPFATVRTSLGSCRLRAPTGEDQEALVELTDGAAAIRMLLGRCLVGDSIRESDSLCMPAAVPPAWKVRDVRLMEQALERISPEVTTAVQSRCPECDATNRVPADPYICLLSADRSILLEVHALATAYHWSEADILRLPRRRRRMYLDLVDRSRGIAAT